MSEPTMADAPQQVSITASGPTSRVVVDGTDLSKAVRGYALQHQVNESPQLVLYAARGGETHFEGMARVAVATETEQDPAETIVGFLRSVDPVALERAALERDDLDGTRHELTRAMLAQLADYALGRT